VADNWTCEVTINDGHTDGTTLMSNSLILKNFAELTINTNDPPSTSEEMADLLLTTGINITNMSYSCDQLTWTDTMNYTETTPGSGLNVTSFNLTNTSLGCTVSEGEKTVYANVSSSDGLAVIVFDAINYDLSNPTITSISPQNEEVVPNLSVVFFFNVTDDWSEIDLCRLYVDGTANGAAMLDPDRNTTLNFTRTAASLGDGQHNWSVYCRDDSEAHWANYSETRNVTIGVTGPTVNSVDVNASSIGFNHSVNITANITKFYYDIDTVLFNITFPNSTVMSISTTNDTIDIFWAVLNDTWLAGEYNVTVFANDSFNYISNSLNNFTVDVNGSLDVYTGSLTYPPNTVVNLAAASSINMTANTTAYLTMKVQNTSDGGATWNDIQTIVSSQMNTSSPNLSLAGEWNDAGSFNTASHPNGTYRIHAEFTDVFGRALNGSNGTFLNNSYNFLILEYADINSINVTPPEIGYGHNVTIFANITYVGGIYNAWVNVTNISDDSRNYDMSNTGDIWNASVTGTL